MARYLLDTNVFIQARNLHYGFDFCPAFWDWLREQHRLGTVGSIEQVLDELVDEELAEWAADCDDSFFSAPDEATLAALTAVSVWVTEQNYEQAAISTFFQVADYWLVAEALARDCAVVTHEVPAQSARKIKIPNVCVGLGVRCLTPYAMLRRERARFVLGAR